MAPPTPLEPDAMLSHAAGEPGLPPVDTLRRSVALFKAFLVEQTDPDRFYGLLAADSVREVSRFTDLSGRLVLDVGAGPGYFANAFTGAGARYVSVDIDESELGTAPARRRGAVLGTALSLPIADASVDVAYSSNLIEHVADPWRMGAEMIRVTRPGGLVVMSYTNWLSPWGGHETAPWHYLGGHRAARRYARRHGHPPKNVYGSSLFPVSVGGGLRWARRQAACGTVDLLAARPRYHPRGARWVVHVPGLRELATWNLVLVLRRR